MKRAEPPSHTRMLVCFDGDRALAYDCQRRLGHIALTDDIGDFCRAHDLGPDALSLERVTVGGHSSSFCPRCQA
jgi:formamidopyrimidine-DNA glycosylase